MARIRTIKPGFFRHEDLQNLEKAHPGKCLMLVFAGLWGHCDRNGVFEWRPNMLKLDILPFLPFEMAETLDLLCKAGQVKRFKGDDGKEYGCIRSFTDHQRITGKEADEDSKYPEPPEVFPEDSPLFPGETLGKQSGRQEGKGREQEGKGRGREGNGLVGIPFQAIVHAYNSTMGKLPKVREITSKRRAAIRTVWQESATRRSPEFWEAYFEECAADNFLNGTGPYRNGHENWRPDFDYLIRGATVTKVFEKAMHRLEQRQQTPGVH